MNRVISYGEIDGRWVPYLLLLITGVSIALMLPMAKIAVAKGIDPLAYAFWQATGAGLILFTFNLFNGGMGAKLHKRYFMISGLTAIAIPNAVAFSIAVELGAAITSVYYALPSLVTYGLALLLKLERIQRLRVTGLFISVAGCAWVLLGNQSVEITSSSINTMLLGLLIPVALGIGNIYRTRAWPKGATPNQLAPGMLMGGALGIFIYLILQNRLEVLWVAHAQVLLILIVQSLITAQSYLWFFKLQKLATPVFISQLGFVIIPTGSLAGVLFLGEQIGVDFILGVSVLFLGMWLGNRT